MHLKTVIFVILILGAIWPAHAQFVQSKQNTKVLLNAQFIERDNEKDITILRDNVQVILEQNFITCNEAIILWSKNEIVAVGNVLLKSAKSNVKADKIIFNFKNDTGKIYNGVILSGQVLMQSEFIDKTGPDTYKADNAYFTSCETCAASWSFTADSIDATIEGYAYIKNPWLHILEVPVLYMPYLIIPLKNNRQTGLLPPSFSVSTYTGTGIDIPYFWAISRSQDMTVTASFFQRSGIQGALNYRYRLSEKSGGELTNYYLQDKMANYKSRWLTTYGHYLELPNDYIQRTTINFVSDTDYGGDFVYFPFRGESALDNRTSITKNFENFHLSIDSSFYVSILQENIDAGKDTSVHRLPEIRLNLTDKKIFDNPNVFFRLDTQYVNFSRQSLGYDSPYIYNAGPTSMTGYRPISSTGQFDPANDYIRTGQRLDIQPHFYAPFRLFNNKIDFTPFVTYRQTQYLLGALNDAQNFDSFPHRNYLMYGVQTSTEFSAIYKGSEHSYRHSIIPSVNFQTIPWVSQSNHSFFGSQEQIPYFMQTQPLQNSDLLAGGRGLQFDYEDRIVGKRLVNFSLVNKVMQKRVSVLGTQYDQTFLFNLSQAYDFIEAKKTNGLPWQDLRGTMTIRMGKIDSLTEAFHFPYHKVTNVSSRIRFNVIDTNFLEFIYSNYLIVPFDPSAVNRDLRREGLWISAGLNTKYATLSGQLEFSLVDEDNPWKQWRLNTEIIPPGRCWTISANFSKNLDEDNFIWNAMVNFKFGN